MRIEAWGPDLATCCEEAIAGLLDTCVDRAAAGVSLVARHAVHVTGVDDLHLLLDLLDETVFLLDTSEGVPVGAAVHRSGQGLDATFELADADTVEAAGSVPKAVARSELELDTRDDEVRCRFLVDV